MCISRSSGFVLLLSLATAGGCSNSNQAGLGTVTGAVFIDGQPASAGLKLEFDLMEKGVRGSTAVTDANGRYEAEYSLSRKGVRLGECLVKLVPPETVPAARGGKRQLPFPEKYYEEIRQVNIVAGYNTIDLEISKSEP